LRGSARAEAAFVEARLSLDQTIIEFVDALRQNGLKVGASETLEGLRALELVGLVDRSMTQAALRSTLCKRQSDVEVFDRVFDVFFRGATRLVEAMDRSLAEQLEKRGLLDGDDLKMIVATLNEFRGHLSPLTQSLVDGDRARLSGVLRQATLQLDFSLMQSALQAGFFNRRLLSGAGVDAARSEVRIIERELRARGVSVEGVEFVSRHLGQVLREVEQLARQEVDRGFEARHAAAGGLPDKAFQRLSRAELGVVEAAVHALAERLKARLVRRDVSRRRGKLHSQATLRRNLSVSGIPMVPQFRKLSPHRPDVLILCDVSDSVRNASRMMLLFAYTLQTVFSKVRSFVFVSELGEITKFFKDSTPEEALDSVARSSVISTSGNSNYGAAFAEFSRSYLGSLTRRTTVFVIGDGRNNYNEANTWALREIKRKAKRLVWICTEPRENWGLGDSLMLSYERCVSQVVIVRSLSELGTMASLLPG
jgi:uncharacterized protein with von Willebrand factor type A (vWA) domain